MKKVICEESFYCAIGVEMFLNRLSPLICYLHRSAFLFVEKFDLDKVLLILKSLTDDADFFHALSSSLV